MTSAQENINELAQKYQEVDITACFLSAIKPPARLGVSKSFSGVIMKNLTDAWVFPMDMVKCQVKNMQLKQ